MKGDSPLFQEYKALVAQADRAFARMGREYAPCIRCRTTCADCCHAVFGLFLIEAAYLKDRLNQVGREERRVVARRGEKAQREILKLEQRISIGSEAPGKASQALARERVRCPLLDQKDHCTLYAHRPITCRVYGMPILAGGGIKICAKSGFDPSRTYPVFNLDQAYQKLFSLSRGILMQEGAPDLGRAALLVSLPWVIQTPLTELVRGSPE